MAVSKVNKNEENIAITNLEMLFSPFEAKVMKKDILFNSLRKGNWNYRNIETDIKECLSCTELAVNLLKDYSEEEAEICLKNIAEKITRLSACEFKALEVVLNSNNNVHTDKTNVNNYKGYWDNYSKSTLINMIEDIKIWAKDFKEFTGIKYKCIWKSFEDKMKDTSELNKKSKKQLTILIENLYRFGANRLETGTENDLLWYWWEFDILIDKSGGYSSVFNTVFVNKINGKKRTKNKFLDYKENFIGTITDCHYDRLLVLNYNFISIVNEYAWKMIPNEDNQFLFKSLGDCIQGLRCLLHYESTYTKDLNDFLAIKEKIKILMETYTGNSYYDTKAFFTGMNKLLIEYNEEFLTNNIKEAS